MNMPANTRDPLEHGPAPVSFPGEELVLVDSADTEVGYATKQAAHEGEGQLHRAFSVFLFDDRQQLLVHRRSAHKPLWPHYWTNSCCSHPRRGETLEAAVVRRLQEELGVAADTRRAFSFEYHAHFGAVGSEHELCHVFLGHLRGGSAIQVHAQEIDAVRWLSLAEVDAWMSGDTAELTPWFCQEWALLRGAYADRLNEFLNTMVPPRSAA